MPSVAVRDVDALDSLPDEKLKQQDAAYLVRFAKCALYASGHVWTSTLTTVASGPSAGKTWDRQAL
jgi:hypothetical protein